MVRFSKEELKKIDEMSDDQCFTAEIIEKYRCEKCNKIYTQEFEAKKCCEKKAILQGKYYIICKKRKITETKDGFFVEKEKTIEDKDKKIEKLTECFHKMREALKIKCDEYAELQAEIQKLKNPLCIEKRHLFTNKNTGSRINYCWYCGKRK